MRRSRAVVTSKSRAREEPITREAIARWTHETRITFNKAVELVVLRDHRENDTKRNAKTRTRNLLNDNIRRQKLSYADPHRREFRIGELGRFLQSSWLRDKFSDIPADITIRLDSQEMATESGCPGAIEPPEFPNSVPQCHAVIAAIHDSLVTCRTELTKVTRERARLKRDLEKRDAKSERASASGKQGGRGNTK